MKTRKKNKALTIEECILNKKCRSKMDIIVLGLFK
jgi:hypothetical protein